MTAVELSSEATDALVKRLFQATIDALEVAWIHVGSRLGYYRALAGGTLMTPARRGAGAATSFVSVPSSAESGLAAATHLLEHPELADRARPFVKPDGIDWFGIWRTPPWSSREERVLRAAADLNGAARPGEMAPLCLSELASTELWDPSPYARQAEDHSHRVLEALAIRRGLTPAAAEVWLSMRYDVIARALDVWDWGALPTEVDAATHILSSRRLAARTEKSLYFRVLPRVFESLDAGEWAQDERLMIESARALTVGGTGPSLDELAMGLDEEQLAAVVEGLYIAWQSE